MKLFLTLCESYDHISQTAFLQYKDAEAYLKNLKLECWDYLDHTKEENQKYDEANRKRLHFAMVAIVFQALAVEAFINLYGAYRVGEDKFYSEYEQKGATTVEKLKKLCKDVLNKNFPTNTREYSRLISLMKKRDDIVHTKPCSIPMEVSCTSIPNYKSVFKQVEFMYKKIDEEIQTYEALKQTLKQLEGKDYDLIEEIADSIQSEIAAIGDVISQILAEYLD